MAKVSKERLRVNYQFKSKAQNDRVKNEKKFMPCTAMKNC